MQGRLAIHAVLFALIASLDHFAVLGSRLEVTTPGKRPEAAAAATTEGTADLVEDLPGWGKPTSRLFAGCALFVCQYDRQAVRVSASARGLLCTCLSIRGAASGGGRHLPSLCERDSSRPRGPGGGRGGGESLSA